jgi:hypothetical protein
VQVDPFELTLKEAGTKHLKPKYHKLLSNFAFKFYLRRYTGEPSGTFKYFLKIVPTTYTKKHGIMDLIRLGRAVKDGANVAGGVAGAGKVRRCRLTLSNPR